MKELPSEDLPSSEKLADMNAEAPAYPWGDVTNGGVMGGLTKRELFAAMAMQGIMQGTLRNDDPWLAADRAVSVADILLKELAK